MDKTSYYIWLSEQRRGNDISEATAEKINHNMQTSGISVLHIESPDFPNKLRAIQNPPLVLFCKGDIGIMKTICKGDTPAVALVGTRRASPYGKWIAREIGFTIAQCKAVHISGMAEGIDVAGHRAVLDANGKSIAVLGTGVDTCFPRSSEDVYTRLAKSGLLVSEYCPGTWGHKENFPERNRIISALSDKCVIVEGALRSGSLITARLALEQGKDLYAVPGNINQPNSIGPNTLIEDGAIPIANPNEIAETLCLK